MYQVGEFIVHPGQGVCEVKDVKTGEKNMYYLMPVNQRHPMMITFPIANEARLRPVLSRDEAKELIDSYPTMEVEKFKAKNNALEEEHFKDVIRQGTCEDTVRVVKTFRRRINDVRANNKKPPVAYERILKQASERSLSELAVALDSTPDEVKSLFETQGEEFFSEN